MIPPEQDRWKQAAAEEAAKIVEEGMVLGLGTGSTAVFFLHALAGRIARENLRITGIPTSERTAALARELKIPLTSFAEHAEIDLAFDGADEVELGTLYLIKGRGGAMLREKIVAASSRQLVVLADETKIVNRLGLLVAVPVEVVQFGWQATERKLKGLGGNPSIRLGGDGKPCLTDSGNFIIDCAFGPMEKPKDIAHHLDHVIGGVEHGLFLKFVERVFVGGRDGVKVLKKANAPVLKSPS